MTAWPVTEWTLDQLAERVGAALSVDYDGQASGRVREVPDQRAIRYYTTIGLVDRPAAMRGRTALYVRRHLLQLVAIKRLQAGGLTLARIQRELAGATDAQLERVARVPPLEGPAGTAPEAALTPTGTAPEAALTPAAAPAAAAPLTPRPAFWKHAPRGGAGSPPGFKAATAGAEPPATRAAAAHDAGAPAPTPGADTAAPMAAADEAGVREAPAPAATATAPEAAPAPTPAGPRPSPAVAAVVIQGVRLGAGVTLLVEGERALGADEVAAIRAAAGPLVDLVRRGRERS
jgi:MerR HTH family regulatory protein